MRKILFIAICCIFNFYAHADIIPNPSLAYNVTTPKQKHKVRMEAEKVVVNMYRDSAVVECEFLMKNYGESVTMEVGFPDMNFHRYHQIPQRKDPKTGKWVDDYESWIEQNRKYLHINVDGRDLNADSLILSAFRTDEYKVPWFVWHEHFKKHDKRVIKVSYSLPPGVEQLIREEYASYNNFQYILETGSVWHGSIGKVDIEIRLHNIDLKAIESVSPQGWHFDIKNKSFTWHLTDIEPMQNDNIKIVYYDSMLYLSGKAPTKRLPAKWYRKNIMVKH